GWATDPLGGFFFFGGGLGNQFTLRPGTYKVVVNVTLMWRKLLHIALANGTGTVKVTVKSGPVCRCQPAPAARARALPRLPNVPVLANPPQSALPDMVPLPSWGIRVGNIKATATRPASARLSFGATMTVEGNARLDVEGFRTPGTPTLRAYQYFWDNND